MRFYKFAPIAARCFPTIADIYNPWIFPPDVSVVINVSQRYDESIACELNRRGIEYHLLPLDEEVEDIGWENIVKAVKILLKADKDNKKMIVHCDFGQHRSRLVIEAFHFAKLGIHFIDNYKGYENHLIYNCKTNHLPQLEDTELTLRFLG